MSDDELYCAIAEALDTYLSRPPWPAADRVFYSVARHIAADGEVWGTYRLKELCSMYFCTPWVRKAWRRRCAKNCRFAQEYDSRSQFRCSILAWGHDRPPEQIVSFLIRSYRNALRRRRYRLRKAG